MSPYFTQQRTHRWYFSWIDHQTGKDVTAPGRQSGYMYPLCFATHSFQDPPEIPPSGARAGNQTVWMENIPNKNPPILLSVDFWQAPMLTRDRLIRPPHDLKPQHEDGTILGFRPQRVLNPKPRFWYNGCSNPWNDTGQGDLSEWDVRRWKFSTAFLAAVRKELKKKPEEEKADAPAAAEHQFGNVRDDELDGLILAAWFWRMRAYCNVYRNREQEDEDDIKDEDEERMKDDTCNIYMPVDIRSFLGREHKEVLHTKSRSYKDFVGNATVWTKTSQDHRTLIGENGLRDAVKALAAMRSRVENEYQSAQDLMHKASRRGQNYYHTQLYMFGEQINYERDMIVYDCRNTPSPDVDTKGEGYPRYLDLSFDQRDPNATPVDIKPIVRPIAAAIGYITSGPDPAAKDSAVANRARNHEIDYRTSLPKTDISMLRSDRFGKEQILFQNPKLWNVDLAFQQEEN